MLRSCAHRVLPIWLAAAFTAATAPVCAAHDMETYATLKAGLSDTFDELRSGWPELETASLIPPFLDGLITDEASTTRVPAFEQPELGPAGISLIDFRVLLLQMSFAVGSNDQIPLVRSQSRDTPQVIAIQAGTVDLQGVKTWAAAQPDASYLLNGETFRAPILVLQDAQLELKPGDQLHLSKEDGAFLVNLGRLAIDGAEIKGTVGSNPNDDSFAPFVTTIGTGMAQINDSRFDNLGFGKTTTFSGLSVVNRGLYEPLGASFLAGSRLHNVGAVGFDGTADLVVANNIFAGTSGGALLVRKSETPLIEGNVFVENQNGSALLVTEGSNGAVISRNVVLGSHGSGIIVSKGSNNTVVADNTVWNSAGGGISVVDSDCSYVSGNLSIDNLRKGLELRSSQSAVVTDNRIMGNRSAGLFVSEQPLGTDTIIRRNTFVGNRIGLGSASPNRVHLYANDFSDQFPRFLDGDFASQSAAIMSDLSGEQSITLTASGVESFADGPQTCTYKLEG